MPKAQLASYIAARTKDATIARDDENIRIFRVNTVRGRPGRNRLNGEVKTFGLNNGALGNGVYVDTSNGGKVLVCCDVYYSRRRDTLECWIIWQECSVCIVLTRT